MGAWGTGNWENDDALDWIGELHDIRDVEEAFLSDRRTTGSCCRALAAAEVVAACAGRPGPGLPDEIGEWVSRNKDRVAEALIVGAMDAVRGVASDSELQVLFDERGRDEGWHAHLDDLLHRLAART